VLRGYDVGDDVHDDGWVGLVVHHATDKFLHCCGFLLKRTAGDTGFELLEVGRTVRWLQEERAHTHMCSNIGRDQL
jgi:hypothetical protein